MAPKGYFSPLQSTVTGTVDVMSYHFLRSYLSGSTAGTPSIFERLGLKDSDGKIFRANSHQFRHWLNTMAQSGGLSEMDIARWMGRDIGQNAAYDHTTPRE